MRVYPPVISEIPLFYRGDCDAQECGIAGWKLDGRHEKGRGSVGAITGGSQDQDWVTTEVLLTPESGVECKSPKFILPLVKSADEMCLNHLLHLSNPEMPDAVKDKFIPCVASYPVRGFS